MRKPRIFIASSTESLDVADAFNINLDHKTEVTIWKNGFQLSQSTIDSLVKIAESVDFSIFIFTPDDLIKIRSQEKSAVRDNVLFELGLFVGTLGKERCFIVKPRDTDLHFPTDLLGLTPADYNGERSDGNLEAAVNHPCILIKKEITKLGLISQDLEIQQKSRRKIAYNYVVGKNEYRLLTRILEGYSSFPKGEAAWRIFHDLKNFEQGEFNLSAIKLERMGFLDKSIDNDENDEEFYRYI
ncbi:MAG: nucleotide-binding protein, partial [Alphaproteobacteria bacterium]|nr:nucleotide-binding protein [Alphaproteobacteria bacterium]